VVAATGSMVTVAKGRREKNSKFDIRSGPNAKGFGRSQKKVGAKVTVTYVMKRDFFTVGGELYWQADNKFAKSNIIRPFF